MAVGIPARASRCPHMYVNALAAQIIMRGAAKISQLTDLFIHLNSWP